ncbi:MAG TPA: ester cyclase [Acidimicrobiales bacterium]
MTPNKTAARRLLEEAWSGELDVVHEVVAPDASPPHEGAGFAPGPDGWRQEIMFIRAGLPDLVVKVREMIEEGDAVAASWHSSGTHTGTLFGIPPTGRSVEMDGLTMFHLRDGRLVKHHTLEDRVALMTQIGVLAEFGQEGAPNS